VRLLVQAGPKGRAAGFIVKTVAASSSTTSFHLKLAGIVQSRREARSII
jgi:hypothetical protein